MTHAWNEEPLNEQQRALREELSALLGTVATRDLIDLLMERSFERRATDLHFDPTPGGLRVRLRIDGILHDVIVLPDEIRNQVISRLKLISGMNITEHRFPQDGRISMTVLDRLRDIRVGSSPTIYGERLVLRLMPDRQTFANLNDLGMFPAQLERMQTAIRSAYGMILSAGPVGSGKTTTMYSCLDQLNQPGRSLVTIEDPVERRIPGVNQIQVEPAQEFGFVEALKGALRQDPNVIMVGEIRDPETAQIASRASLTGILSLSTIHANDAASVVGIFREYDIKPLFIADSLRGVVSQRLIRKNCDSCLRELSPEEVPAAALGLEPGDPRLSQLRMGTGCKQCFGSGYYGRIGVYEIMLMTPELRSAIIHGKGPGEIRELAHEQGMQTLDEAVREHVLAGRTTMQEFHRVLASF